MSPGVSVVEPTHVVVLFFVRDTGNGACRQRINLRSIQRPLHPPLGVARMLAEARVWSDMTTVEAARENILKAMRRHGERGQPAYLSDVEFDSSRAVLTYRHSRMLRRSGGHCGLQRYAATDVTVRL